MEVAFARLGQVPQPNVRMVALVVPMIVFISSMLWCLDAESSEVPEHAYITYGDNWKCERGFKRAEDECQSIKVPEKEAPSEIPEHAFADYKDPWKCKRGFKRTEDECQSIKVPEHAFLTGSSSGDGWKCERAFKREDNRCSPK